MLIRPKCLVFKKSWQQIMPLHFAFGKTLLASLNILVHVIIQGSSIFLNCLIVRAYLHIDVEEYLEQSKHRMAKLLCVFGESLLRQIVHSFTQSHFLLWEFIWVYIVDLEIKSVVFVVFSETNMANRASYNDFKLFWNVYASFTALCYFCLPSSARRVQMLLEHLTHDRKFLLVEHRCARFSFDAPLIGCLHYRPPVTKDGHKHISHNHVLVNKFVLRREDLFNDLRVWNVSAYFI